VQISCSLVLLIIVAGTIAYSFLGLSPLDALYQTVTTISTVGFREYGNPTAAWKITTIAVIFVGVGAALYTLGLVLETLVEGRLNERWERRRLERKIGAMKDHIIICGWGRVGRAIHASLGAEGAGTVVIDSDPERVALVAGPVVEGDATDDDVLRRAGIEQARCLIVALVTGVSARRSAGGRRVEPGRPDRGCLADPRHDRRVDPRGARAGRRVRDEPVAPPPAAPRTGAHCHRHRCADRRAQRTRGRRLTKL
jgi:hypothetical protein